MSSLFDEVELKPPPSLFDEVELRPDTTEVGEEPAKGERVLSLFDDVLVGDVAAPPQSTPRPVARDISGEKFDTSKIAPVPPAFKVLRAAKHRPEIRWMLDRLQDGKWALGLAAQGLAVGPDVLRAWTQGEHVSNPEQFQARIQRGKTVFDVFKKSAIAKGLEQIEKIEDPVARSQAIEILSQQYDISDPIDLMTEPKLREQLADLEFGLTQAPPFMTIAEMFFGNTRPALETLPFVNAMIPGGEINPQGFAAITYDVAKQLRKDPTEVTMGEIAVDILDRGQRAWMRLTEDLPEIDTEVLGVPAKFPRDLPALAMTAQMMPAEVFYDPLFITAESGLGAAAARGTFRGARAGVGLAKKGVVKAGAKLPKKPPPPPIPEKPPIVTPPPKGPFTPKEGVTPVPIPEVPAAPATAVAIKAPQTAAVNPRLAELREKYQRSGVGKNLRFHHTSLEGLEGILGAGKIIGAPAEGSRNVGEVFLTRTDVSKVAREGEGYFKEQAKGFPFQTAFGSVRLVFDADDLKTQGVRLAPRDVIKAKSAKVTRGATEAEAEEVVRPFRKEPKVEQGLSVGTRVVDDYTQGLLEKLKVDTEEIRIAARRDPAGMLRELKDALLGHGNVASELLPLYRHAQTKQLVREIDSSLRAFGELELSELQLRNALRVEIDPAALQAGSRFEVVGPGAQEAKRAQVTKLAQELEQKWNIPVVIKPFFAQSEVKAYRPFVAEDQVAERIIRGPDPSLPQAHSLASVANLPAQGGMTSVDRTLPVIREMELPVDHRIGGVVEDMKLTGDPEAMGKQLQDLSRPPGAAKTIDAFLPSGPVFQLDFWKRPPFQRKGPFVPIASGPPPKFPGTQLDFFEEAPPPPPQIIDPARLLSAHSSYTPSPDISLPERNLLSSRWVLFEDPNDGIARGVYKTQRRSYFDAMGRANEHAQVFKGMNQLLAKAGTRGYSKLSKRLFEAMNARPGRDIVSKMKPLSKTEREVVQKTRRFIEDWLDAKGFAEKKADRGLLEAIGFYIWPEDEFLITTKDGQLRRGAFPSELTDIPVMDNALFKHLYPGMKASEDIVSAMRAMSAGMIRQDILKPAWKTMREAAKNLPPRKQQYVNFWLKGLEGRPSAFAEAFDEMVHAFRADTQQPLYVSGVNELTSAVLGGYYRGHLFGNLSTFFSNFFGQGLSNQAAKNGAFRTLEALGRHWKHGFDGAPKEAFMGGFEALFAREVPKSTFGLKLRSQPGIKQFRNFWNEIAEPQLGMLGSEFTNRSWAMHLGLADALDNYNLRNGTEITWQQLLRGELKDAGPVRDNLMYEAMLHSDQVNHVYGVAGANPIIRHYFGHGLIAPATQFLSWPIKQAEFLLGPLMKKGDPGILTNYILFSGWLAQLATRSWGIDYQRSTLWGSLPQAQGSGAPFPAGPPVDAIWTFFQAVDEEVNGDPNQAKRHWEELTRHLETLTLPGVSAREKAEVFWKSLETGGLYTPHHLFYSTFLEERPRELLAFTGPTAAEQQGPIFGRAGGFDPNPENLEKNIINILRSETPARAAGLPTVSDRQRRRIETEIRRMNKIWLSLMTDLTNGILVEIQEGRGPTDAMPDGGPRFQALLEAAEKQGLPIAPLLEDRVLDIALPRILRMLEDSRGLTKQMILPNIQREFPDYFDDPLRVWDRSQPPGPEVESLFDEVLVK